MVALAYWSIGADYGKKKNRFDYSSQTFFTPASRRPRENIRNFRQYTLFKMG